MDLSLPLPGANTLGGLLAEQAARLGEREFLRFEGRRYSYRDMDRLANRVAHGLAAQGVGRGDKVCLLLPNCPEFLVTAYALARLGAVQVPVNTALRGGGLRHVLHHSDARLVVVGAEFLPQLSEVATELPQVEAVAVLGDGPRPTLTQRTLDFGALMSADEAPPAVDVHVTDLAAILYTSGTTGPAKGVMLPHTYLAHWLPVVRQEVLRIRASDVWYTCLPLFHVNAQFITAATCLRAGASVVLARRFSASGFWAEVAGCGATVFSLIGSMATILMKQPVRPEERQHRVSLAYGAPIPREIFTAFEQRFGLKVMEGFGMTEITPGLMMPWDAPRPGSMGKAIANVEARVVDEHDFPVPSGEIGELVLRPISPNAMMLGYYKDQAATLAAWRNLWFHTGDAARLDADGYFYFIDRKKDAIRRRGENISSFEVEQAVNSHPAVAESAAIAVPAAVGEDDVKVLLQLKPGHTLDPEEFFAFLRPRLASFALPRYVEVVADFPRTGTLRIEKFRLRQHWRTPNTWDREIGCHLAAVE